MNTQSEENMYKTLASVVLPEGILKVFEISGVNVERTGEIEETGVT